MRFAIIVALATLAVVCCSHSADAWVAAGKASLSCPNVTTVNLNWPDYLGTWYEIALSPLGRETFEAGCQCTRANYSVIDSDTVGVHNTCNLNSKTGPQRSAQGTAKIVGPGKLAVSFSSLSPRSPYWIIQYDGSYAVVWSCFEVFGVQVGATMWVLNRQPTMDRNLYNAVVAKAKQQTGFDVSSLTYTVQDGCKY